LWRCPWLGRGVLGGIAPTHNGQPACGRGLQRLGAVTVSGTSTHNVGYYSISQYHLILQHGQVPCVFPQSFWQYQNAAFKSSDGGIAVAYRP